MISTASILSHLAAVGIGIALAASATGYFRHPGPAAPPAGKPVVRASPTETVPHARMKTDKPTKESLTTVDFQGAWNGLATRKLSRSARIPIQRKLLEAWAQVDLRGALDAAMKEAWGGGDHFVGTSAFSQVFADRPLDAWALIQSGRYGVGAQSLREQWVTAVLAKNRLLVASMLAEFPGRMPKRVIPELLWGIQSDPERDAIVAKIVEQAGDDHDDWLQDTFKKLPGGGDPAALRDRWSALPAGSARKVAIMQWSAGLRDLSEDNLAAELAQVPPEMKGEATKAVLSQIDETSPGLLPAMKFAIASDQWGAVAKSVTSQLANFSEHSDTAPQKLAEWGTNLPERPDTVEIYHKAIGRYIREDLPRAKQWLTTMPEGSWQRENGLAEFSQQALWRKNDPAASQWALDTISDPEVKAEATRWRQDWKRQTGGGTR